MNQSLTVRACMVLSLSLTLATTALAQITESNWNSTLTGAQDWQVDANWDTTAFPNDPGREDMDSTTILPVIGANVSVALGADLDLNVGATDVTVASLRLGGTVGPVTTTVSSTGGRLVFENYELNDETDPENIIPSFNSSRAMIVSGGVAGSTNVITAPVHINDETLDVGSFDTFQTTNDLTFSGQLTFRGGASLNAVGADTFVQVTGPVTTESIPNEDPLLEPTLTTARFNSAAGATGTVHVLSDVTGPGSLRVNGGGGTTILSGANLTTGFSQGNGDLYLDHDLAMGGSDIRIGSGGTFYSTDDARTVSVNMRMANSPNVAGDHSLTWLGSITQSNNRQWNNYLAPGKTFTIAGEIATDADAPEATPNKRIFIFNGSGDWIISGKMMNRLHSEEYPLPESDQPQSFAVRGTGDVHVTGTENTYSADTFVQGGTLHYATNASLPVATFKSYAGAVGIDTGSIYQSGGAGVENSEFLAKFNNRDQGPYTIQGDFESFEDYDAGGLMLAPSEAASSIDFTSGSLVNARDMSLAGPAEGITFTGNVTPANSTYRFGGGTGVITLPGANQLTGGNSLVVENGLDSGDDQGLGSVRITGTNNYTGGTQVRGEYISGRGFNGTTLSVTDLANGGADSSIGNSNSAAENLVLQGGTLKYEGAGGATDRLFTIGTHGASLDSSGAGAISFTNTGALAIGTATARSGVTSGLAFGHKTGVTEASTSVAFNLPDTSDLVNGMQVFDDTGFLVEDPLDDDEVITIVGIQSQSRIRFSDGLGLFVNFNEDPSTLSFIDVERTFTLKGDNTGDNTLAPVIGDSATNVVNLAKQGAGKWVLTGENTYTGDTSVLEGVLSITNAYLADSADVLIDTGAVFDLDFDGTDLINQLFFDGMAALPGTYGAFGSGADFESDFFTGTGLLGVPLSTDPTGVVGDYNNDGIVDAVDYAVWRENLGEAEGTLQNDPIGGVVGTAHYNQWMDNFGSTTPGPASVTIPEPTTVGLSLLALAGCMWRRRRG